MHIQLLELSKGLNVSGVQMSPFTITLKSAFLTWADRVGFAKFKTRKHPIEDMAMITVLWLRLPMLRM